MVGTLTMVDISESRYFRERLSSKGHTPIYKLHKYFARRPHNQFRSIIEHYVPENGVVLDCFAGGGVSLIEGLTAGRRVLSVDINPMASLIQLAQVLEVSSNRINEISAEIASEVFQSVGPWYATPCRSCGQPSTYRWIERAYLVNCPHCQALTSLGEVNKAVNSSGRLVNGRYSCIECASSFESVSTKRVDSQILNIRYKCSACKVEETAEPLVWDIELAASIKSDEGNYLREHSLNIPTDCFPLEWDRQLEDALFRKGFERFSDLFTPRNRMTLAYFFKLLEIRKNQLTDDEFVSVLTQFSSLLRYVNTMTFSTSSWMDGRPVAWAKHAYWTPNQFIEVNPFEYLSHRQLATNRWDKDRRSRFVDKRRGATLLEVVKGDADYAVACLDSRILPIPDNSVDAVITDPPFGGNVQYGELTHFWQVWLRSLNPFESQLFDLSSEILMHRKKTRSGICKTAVEYEVGLYEVFKECFRVLKSTSVLCFTFNNKSADAWYSVMKAAINAGFHLERDGIHYQEEITAYRDTAHLRYNGELQGDVLYSFVKERTNDDINESFRTPTDWLGSFVAAAELKCLPPKELAVQLHVGVISEAALSIQRCESKTQTLLWLDFLSLIGKSSRDGEALLSACQTILASEFDE